MSYFEAGKYIKGRWVRQDIRKYIGGYPPECEIKPTLSYRIKMALKALRRKCLNSYNSKEKKNDS